MIVFIGEEGMLYNEGMVNNFKKVVKLVSYFVLCDFIKCLIIIKMGLNMIFIKKVRFFLKCKS